MQKSNPDLENQQTPLKNKTFQNGGNHLIVSAAAGVLVGVSLASIGLPSLVTAAVIGAIATPTIDSFLRCNHFRE